MAAPLKALLALALLPVSAHAVAVRGVVTDSLGRAVPFARIQLIQGQRSVAIAISGPDGTYEMRSSASGRFVLLTVSAFAPGVAQGFYGGRTSLVTRNIVLDPNSIQPVLASTATGIPTPLAQISSAVTLIPQDNLRTRVGLVDELAQSPGVFVVQTGQAGGPAALYVRGGDADANKILMDGISAEDPGGRFDFGTVLASAMGGIEIFRGADSVLYGPGAEASVVSLATATGTTLHPVFLYSGDAGNLHTWRDEATLSGTHSRADYLVDYTRFDTSNALQLDRFHSSTAAANLGYNITSNAQARFTLRNADSASGLPGPHDIFGLSANGRQADQDLYSGMTLENRIGDWHMLARYGIARKREQIFNFAPVGEAISSGGVTSYFGPTVTLRGANGFQATGRAMIDPAGAYPSRQDLIANRDELAFQTDYQFTEHLVGLLGFHYENERGRFAYPALGEDQLLQRTNFDYTAQFQGDIVHRLFYSAGGNVEKNHLYGIRGNPRIGLAYIPVRPGRGKFHGTKIHGTAATGTQEPSLQDEANSLYGLLHQAGDLSSIAQFHVAPIDARRSRTFDVGADQNIVGRKLILKTSYFHNQFSHQIDHLDPGTVQTLFGIPSTTTQLYAEVNTLAFRAQGLEAEIQYQPRQRLFLHGGYTWLDTKVEQSFSTDAAAASAGTPITNPNLPGIAIGSSYALVGARAFRRPPHTGYFAVQYTGNVLTAAIQGNLASRSDDSTFQSFNDIHRGNSLLLPNRNLDFGFAKLDANVTYAITRNFTMFTQLTNLLNQQHIGPIGYPGLPLTVRAGLKIRIGRE